MSTTEQYENEDILNLDSKEAVTKNRAGKLAAGRQVENCDAAGEASIGVVLDTKSAADETVGVLTAGCKKIVSGAAFSDLDKLAVDAAGKYRTATAGQKVVAIALEAATGADQEKLAYLLAPAQYTYVVASAHVADASTAHALNATFSDTEVEAALNALGTKINAILDILEAQGLAATS